ncbi:enoyl-CoA delta isomerase 2-like [Pelodytes ibericus]
MIDSSTPLLMCCALYLHSDPSLLKLRRRAEEGLCSGHKLQRSAGEPSFPMLLPDKSMPRGTELVPKLVSSEFLNRKDASLSGSCSKYETLQVTTQDNITAIIMNRPEKKNAINLQMYVEVKQALENAAIDDSVITVMTGCGDYFSSGNDLSNSRERIPETKEENGVEFTSPFRAFVKQFIDFPKPLVAVVNGPAIGIGVTILGLFDLVYASDQATFQTPFSRLALFPEGCSSYTFPKIMGTAKAIEVLIFNRKLTAYEACDLGLVTEVFPDHSFQQEVWTKLKDYAKLPKNCLVFSKQLIRNVEKEQLHATCDRECKLLSERSHSEEAMAAVKNFLQRKSKL